MTKSVPSRKLRRGPVTDYAIAVVLAVTAIGLVQQAFPASFAGPATLLFFLCVVMLVALASAPGPAALTSGAPTLKDAKITP